MFEREKSHKSPENKKFDIKSSKTIHNYAERKKWILIKTLIALRTNLQIYIAHFGR